MTALGTLSMPRKHRFDVYFVLHEMSVEDKQRRAEAERILEENQRKIEEQQRKMVRLIFLASSSPLALHLGLFSCNGLDCGL